MVPIGLFPAVPYRRGALFYLAKTSVESLRRISSGSGVASVVLVDPL